MIQLQAEVLDLKANPKKAATGTVLEALLDRGRGPVARILVQDGTLRVGDFVLAGTGFGKVRAMTNEEGKQVHEAGPATPVEILGLEEVPGAGDPMYVVKDPKKAREIVESRKKKGGPGTGTAKVTLDDIARRIRESGQQELRVLVKGDVQGSVEAVADTLTKLSTDKVKLSVVHSRPSARSRRTMSTWRFPPRPIILGFNVRPAGKAAQLAEHAGIEIRHYSIIYQAVDDVKSAMEGLLPTTRVEKSAGKAEVRQVFKIKGIAVAGSYVIQGMIKRTAHARLLPRGGHGLGRQARRAQAVQGRRQGRGRRIRVRYQPRRLQRPEGKGHRRVLRNRGDQAEAVISSRTCRTPSVS